MSKINFLKEQIVETRNFVNRLVSELPEDLWYTIPDGTDSNFAWQIGHLIISQHFHAICCVTGKNEAVYKIIPVQEYVKIFNGMGALHRSIEKDLISTSKLKIQLYAVHDICINSISSLNDSILSEELEPIPFNHPIANNKYEALSWCFKHEMWHSAEMEAIKVALGYSIEWKKK